MASVGEGDKRESRRALDRIARESEAGGGRSPDIDARDRMEILGRRIGRALSLAITLALIVGLVRFVFVQG